MTPPTLCVFAGPSLRPQDRVAFPGLVYEAPARRGDVRRACETHRAILLIDGVFHHDLAPSPREVREACRHVTLFGAASMGALRAAECRIFGMRPLGAIANWYVSERLDGDDEVALAMHPHTFAALSVPSVNVRFVAWLARRRGLLHADEAILWIRRARTELYYAERTWEDTIELAPARARSALHAIAEREGDLKRWDALFARRRAVRWLQTARA